MHSLGRIEEKVEGQGKALELFRDDFSEEKDHAHDSRATIHKRLDGQGTQISHLETTVAISGQVDAQLRDTIDGLKKTFEEEVKPALDEWRRIKILGAGAAGVFLFLGISIGTAVAWAGDTAVTAVRHWLRIN